MLFRFGNCENCDQQFVEGIDQGSVSGWCWNHKSDVEKRKQNTAQNVLNHHAKCGILY